MGAVEEIRAAIRKLERLRDTAYLDWAHARDDDGNMAIVSEPSDGNYGVFKYHPSGCLGDGSPDGEMVASANLIVTLYRTIDAQLAILRDATGALRAADYLWDYALVLARAINGGA